MIDIKLFTISEIKQKQAKETTLEASIITAINKFQTSLNTRVNKAVFLTDDFLILFKRLDDDTLTYRVLDYDTYYKLKAQNKL